VKLVLSLGFWRFPLGFVTTKEGWLAVAALARSVAIRATEQGKWQ